MRISEFSARSGLPASTLRYYEREGLLAAPARTGGKRSYAAADVPLARMLRAARQAGFSIADLRALRTLTGRAERRAWLSQRLVRTEAAIVNLRRHRDWLAMAAECDCSLGSACELLG